MRYVLPVRVPSLAYYVYAMTNVLVRHSYSLNNFYMVSGSPHEANSPV